ncbi:MAG: alpha/beta fold hydrolase [Phycisphaerales bacterium]
MSGATSSDGGVSAGWARRRARRRRFMVIALAVWAITVAASWVVQRRSPARAIALEANEIVVEAPLYHADGLAAGVSARFVVSRWGEWDGNGGGGGPVVFLVHGSPGSSRDFGRLGEALAGQGYRVAAIDLFGYAGTRLEGGGRFPVGARSMRATARTCWDVLGAMGVERVSLVGWSNGGGVVVHMADAQSERTASMTLMASIGEQAFEGSGSYRFEHFKYAVGELGLGWGVEVLPHFGALGTAAARTAWLDSFDESDQRDLGESMRRVGEHGVRTLILHGKYDSLAPERSAESAHALISTSRLVILEADHFLPMLQVAESAAWIDRAAGGTEVDGTSSAWAGVEDLSVARRGVGEWVVSVMRRVVDAVPWWVEVLVIAAVCLRGPVLAGVVVSLLIGRASLDPAVAAVGVMVGLVVESVGLWVVGRRSAGLMDVSWLGCVGPRVSGADWRLRMSRGVAIEVLQSTFETRSRRASAVGVGRATAGERDRGGWIVTVWLLVWRLMGSVVVGGLAMVGAVIAVGVCKRLTIEWGVWGLLIQGFVAAGTVGLLVHVASWRGRARIKAWMGRLWRHEYWPTWAWYMPVVPWAAWLAIRHRGALLPTCCNPGIEQGGGIAGESKHAIVQQFVQAGHAVMASRGPGVLTAMLVEADESLERRVECALEAIRTEARLGGFPVIVKADKGERGHSVRLVRDETRLREVLGEISADVVVQAYHPGPHECGVLWVRHPGRRETDPGALGSIYAVTHKEFPVLVGDGVRTLEELILTHPRYRRQAGVFLDRFAAELSRVPGAGDEVRLAQAGNHAQGTLFRDGAHLVTPELSAAIDAMVRDFGGLDFGRFDLRYTSVEALREGREFGIVELNGLTSEPTNMYDPGRSPVWAYGVLLGLWARMYALGADRRDRGARAMGLVEIVQVVASHAHGKSRGAKSSASVAD